MRRDRRRRPDDWTTSHARARSDLSDRLDGVLDPGEARWLENHLADCADCRALATAYEADRTALRGLREQQPLPPRDLWARTAAAIEQESRFRDHRVAAERRRRARSSALAAALVVVVAAGVLTSSQLLGGGGRGVATPGPEVAAASNVAASRPADATSIPISQKVHWITETEDGRYAYTTMEVREVCPTDGEKCNAGAPPQDQPVQITTDPDTVFGSTDGARLIVGSNSTVAVVPLASPPPAALGTPIPTASHAPTTAISSPASPSATASGEATPGPRATGSAGPTPSGGPSTSAPPAASGSPSEAAVGSPTPSSSETPPPTPRIQATESAAATASVVTISPSPSAQGAIEIARDVVLVGQSAAYSPSGDWFAFTARRADGSAGPDIYVWKVGDPKARAVTIDHKSTFGSWIGDDIMVGSTIVEGPGGSAASTSPAPDRTSVSFLLDPRDGTQVALPETGRTWRPSVDPTGRWAVYWTGTLRRAGGPADVPDSGSLVLGDWGTGDNRSATAPRPTPQDQASERHETTIAKGRVPDWDARWDPTGTKLAIWVADPSDPHVGTLSLYSVATFDGRIDLKKPLLDARRANAGFAISNGKLVWAEPTDDGSGPRERISVLAWTDDGVGTIETLPDNVVVIR